MQFNLKVRYQALRLAFVLSMEVDYPKYPNISPDEFLEGKNRIKRDKIVKETLLHSPVIIKIIPNFQVSLSKKFKGPPSVSVNDESDQFLCPREEDSEFDVFNDDEDEIFYNIDDSSGKQPHENKIEEHDPHINLSLVSVIIRTTSLLINGIEFPLKSTVRSACVIKGVENGSTKEEDSLFLSLKSGFLFLIRLFFVRRSWKDIDYEKQLPEGAENSCIFKPFIVQWWDTSSELSVPKLYSSGYSLAAHSSGMTAVSLSASGLFRIYNCQHTDAGIMFMGHYNVPVEGLILHSCFAEPLSNSTLDTHRLFLVLTFTDSRRLEVSLYNWVSGDELTSSLTKTSLPLENTFPIPIFIVPLNNGRFLFVSPKEFIIISVHDITSVNYDFSYTSWDGGFPTNYYKPVASIRELDDSKSDEVLMSTDGGLIYSIIISESGGVSVTPVVRIGEPISIFSLEKFDADYYLTYSNEFGSNREVVISDLFSNDYLDTLTNIHKPKISEMLLIRDYKNWSPVLDSIVIDSFSSRTIRNRSSQELWVLTCTGKRTRLNHLRLGYPARKEGKVYEQLRKAESIKFIFLGDKRYLFCNMPYETLVLETANDFNDDLVELEDPAIDTSKKSLMIDYFAPDLEFILQITNKDILLSNIEETIFSVSLDEEEILACDIMGQYILVITEDANLTKSLKLIEIASLGGLSQREYNYSILSLLTIQYEPSLVRFINKNNSIFIIVSSYDGELHIYKLDENFNFNHQRSYNITAFHFEELDKETFDAFVVSDLKYNGESSIFIGLRNGFYCHLNVDDDFHLSCRNFLRIGDSPVKVVCCLYDKANVFLLSKTLWLINFDDSEYPTQVFFDERYDRNITHVAEIIPNPSEMNADTNLKRLGFIRDEGFTIGSVYTFVKPSVRGASIADTARKIIYMEHISTFILLCKSKDRNRLKLIDRKSMKELSYEPISSTKQNRPLEYIFKKDEYPISGCVWSISRGNKISKKLLIGCSFNEKSGSLKVLDIWKNRSSKPETDFVNITQLASFEHEQQVSAIQQVENNIVFSSGNGIFATRYDQEEKRLKPFVNLASFSSEVTSLNVCQDNSILVSTKFDSIFRLALFEDNDIDFTLRVISKDPSPKSVLNLTLVGRKIAAVDKLHSSLLFFEPVNGSLEASFMYKLPSISKIYLSNFSPYWENTASSVKDPQLICVGFNGEIISIRLIASDGDELQNISQYLAIQKEHGKLIEQVIEILNRPFMEKVTGKGLRSVNKPYFDFHDNKGKVVDYDIDEFTKVKKVKVLL